MIYITDIFAEVIAKINANRPTGSNEIQFLYGHYRAIADEIIEKGLKPETRAGKYPLVIVGIDNEYSEIERNGEQVEFTFNMWIVDETKKEFYTSERYDNVFKAVLYPLFDEIKRGLFRHPSIYSREIDITKTITPIPYWGTQTVQGSGGNIINDPLDAIKVKFSNIIASKGC